MQLYKRSGSMGMVTQLNLIENINKETILKILNDKSS